MRDSEVTTLTDIASPGKVQSLLEEAPEYMLQVFWSVEHIRQTLANVHDYVVHRIIEPQKVTYTFDPYGKGFPGAQDDEVSLSMSFSSTDDEIKEVVFRFEHVLNFFTYKARMAEIRNKLIYELTPEQIEALKFEGLGAIKLYINSL